MGFFASKGVRCAARWGYRGSPVGQGQVSGSMSRLAAARDGELASLGNWKHCVTSGSRWWGFYSPRRGRACKTRWAPAPAHVARSLRTGYGALRHLSPVPALCTAGMRSSHDRHAPCAPTPRRTRCQPTPRPGYHGNASTAGTNGMRRLGGHRTFPVKVEGALSQLFPACHLPYLRLLGASFVQLEC